MTLQEAIKSDKKFRRPHHENWLFITFTGIMYINDSGMVDYPIHVRDVLATDWELAPTAKTLSAKDIRDASFDESLRGCLDPSHLEILIRKLGLE